MTDKLGKYWMCQTCGEKAGGTLPPGTVCTMTFGDCAHCGLPSTLIPFVDFDWPNDKTRDSVAKGNRD